MCTYNNKNGINVISWLSRIFLYSILYNFVHHHYNMAKLYFQSVAQKSEKIGEEETKCQHMADLAQHDLDEALPALEEAMRVRTYNKVKTYFRGKL